ncbi:MAG: MBL fold metallo-hydrolase [Patescibacteria group bacterium]
MIKAEILGAAANWSAPFKTKGIKKFTSVFFQTDARFQIDAGNKWDKRKIDYLLITHLHQDHYGQIKTYPKKIIFCLPSKSFLKILPKDRNYLFLKKKTKIGRTKIEPFLVHHSTTSITYGYKIIFGSTSFIWLPDYFSPFNFSPFKNTDYYFLGASCFRKNILHRGYLTGQKSITNFLKDLRKRKLFPKKRLIYLVHLGLSMFPRDIKIKKLQTEFPDYKLIAVFDGQKIVLK